MPNIVGLGITGEASEIIPSQFGGSWVGHTRRVRGASRVYNRPPPPYIPLSLLHWLQTS